MTVKKLSRGRPRLDPSVKLSKTGVTLPPHMMANLDLIAKFARTSRSTVMAYLLDAPLHDLSESVKETLYLTKNDPDGVVHIDFLAMEFLRHVSSTSQGINGFSIPDEGVENV